MGPKCQKIYLAPKISENLSGSKNVRISVNISENLPGSNNFRNWDQNFRKFIWVQKFPKINPGPKMSENRPKISENLPGFKIFHFSFFRLKTLNSNFYDPKS